jgi:hypothetical protein
LLDQLPREPVESVGFTSIAESGFLCSPAGDALLPAIPWSDPGGTGAVARFESDFGPDEFSRVTGLRLSSTPSVFKLRELGERSVWKGPVRWLSVAEWLAAQFGGAPCSERSLASRTGLLDVTRGRMDERFRTWTGLPLLETELVWAGEFVGEVRTSALLAGAAITIGGHDHLCAAVGSDATLPGDVLNSFGTAEAYIAAVGMTTSPTEVQARRQAGLETGYHVVPDAHSLIIGAPHGRHLSGVIRGLSQPTATIEARHAGTDPAVASPSDLQGDADAQRWLHEVRDVHAASIRLARIIEAQTTVTRIVGTGGWLKSGWISRLKRQDLPSFEPSAQEESAARGAAILAGRAVGAHLPTG